MSLTRAIAVGRDQVEGSTVTSDALKGFLLVFCNGVLVSFVLSIIVLGLAPLSRIGS
jgi:hypothetical protein